MPKFEYDKDYPFAAFVTNLGKYNEGELVGEWVKFPTTPEEMQAVFQRIGIGETDDFGYAYEEWFITDYDCYVDGLYDKLGEYSNIDELNYLASKLDDMMQYDYDRFCAAVYMGDHTSSIQDLINLTENLDCYDVYPDIEDDGIWAAITWRKWMLLWFLSICETTLIMKPTAGTFGSATAANIPTSAMSGTPAAVSWSSTTETGTISRRNTGL